MKERPILFSAPMVRAILDGRKTMTRRVVKGVRGDNCLTLRKPTKTKSGIVTHVLDAPKYPQLCPYGQPGDQLWVREAVWLPRAVTDRDLREGADTWPKCVYSADTDDTEVEWMREMRWKQRPSIHMPRWASRITLGVTGVRVERLHDITAADIKAEGVRIPVCGESGNVMVDVSTPNGPSAFLTRAQFNDTDALLRAHWAALWCEINGRPSWDANPWVWVVEFRAIQLATVA